MQAEFPRQGGTGRPRSVPTPELTGLISALVPLPQGLWKAAMALRWVFYFVYIFVLSSIRL